MTVKQLAPTSASYNFYSINSLHSPLPSPVVEDCNTFFFKKFLKTNTTWSNTKKVMKSSGNTINTHRVGVSSKHTDYRKSDYNPETLVKFKSLESLATNKIQPITPFFI